MSFADDTMHVVEPQMESLFHAPFNAALLHTVALAYPQTGIVFHAAERHIKAVQAILAEYASSLVESIVWRSLPPLTRGSIPGRWRAAHRAFGALLATRQRVLFCSISRLQLFILQRQMSSQSRVCCVLHGDLESIGHRPVGNVLQRFLSLRRALLRPQPRGLRYVVLGESIRDNIPPDLQRSMKQIAVLDHPYHFSELQQNAELPVSAPVFGIFGNTGEAQQFEEIARAVCRQNPEVQFRIVGFVASHATMQRIADIVDHVSAEPLSRERFKAAAAELTHALWLADPAGFKLRASGTFFDALAYCKPLVYTANGYLDRYRPEESGFGTRCVGNAEVIASILAIAAEWKAAEHVARYGEQVNRMLEFRKRFTPEALAKGLLAILGW